MWKKIWQNNAALALLAGFSAVLAFPPINLAPLAPLCPFFFFVVLERETRPKKAALWGFLASLAIMLGAFYWVVYVLHEFGYLPWAVATLLYVGFCGFGAANFPIFAYLACWLQKRFQPQRSPVIWYTLGLPALFTVVEWLIPKLFPWYLGHAFYQTFWVNQIVELTGCSYLTFITASLGGAIFLLVTRWPERRRWMATAVSIAGIFWAYAIGFSLFRAAYPWPAEKPFKVALIQANIGSLEKREARHGMAALVRDVINRYRDLTATALQNGPKPDLILWPETAVPFVLNYDSDFARELKGTIREWGIPLITGGYMQSFTRPDRDYNVAYLLEPTPAGTLQMDVYRKNILLAFGEYLPMADMFPSLYRYVPQVSNFARGITQNPFQLRDGTRVGITICYEAIVPSFFRKVARHDVTLVVNLTNDSWFGPTAEPHQHAALAVFRAIETRIPLARVTNTGISFTVDSTGRMSPTSGVYREGIVQSELRLPKDPPQTVYLRFGDWFIVVSVAIFIAALLRGRRHVPLPV